MSDEGKIFVDSDWKREAQQEKERLAQDLQGGERGKLPEPGFAEVVNMISMQAAIGLGGFQTPDGNQIPPDLEVAKYHIDLLEVLSAKTKGNLDESEQRLLSTALHELRMIFVQVSAALMQARGRGAPEGTSPPAP